MRRAIEEIKLQLGAGVINVGGLFADRPDPGKPGQLFIATNSPFIYMDDGTEWIALHPRTFTPVTGSWATRQTMTQLNFATGTQTPSATQGGDDTYLFDAANATVQIRALYKAAPTVPYTITAAILPNTGFATSAAFIFFTDHAGTNSVPNNAAAKFHALIAQHDAANVGLYSFKFTGMSAPVGATYKSAVQAHGFPFFLRIRDDNTNRICSFSNDGINYSTFHTVGRTDFITATGVGVGFYSQSATDEAGWNWLSWDES